MFTVIFLSSTLKETLSKTFCQSSRAMSRVKKELYLRARKLNQSQAGIVLRVRRFFEQEKKQGKAVNLNSLLDRIAEATGFVRTIVAKIKTEQDVDDYKYDDGHDITFEGKSFAPDKYSSLLRHAARELILDETKSITVDATFEKLSSIAYADVP